MTNFASWRCEGAIHFVRHAAWLSLALLAKYGFYGSVSQCTLAGMDGVCGRCCTRLQGWIWRRKSEIDCLLVIQ